MDLGTRSQTVHQVQGGALRRRYRRHLAARRAHLGAGTSSTSFAGRFIPERRRAQAGAQRRRRSGGVTFEFINANDLQPRITAACIRPGADIIQMLWNWPSSTPRLSTSPTGGAVGKGRRFYEVRVQRAVATAGSSTHAVIGTRSVRRRGSTRRREEFRDWRLSRRRQEAQGQGEAHRQALAQLRRSADLRHPFLWDFGGAGRCQRKKSRSFKGTRLRQFLQLLESLRRGGSLDDTNNNRLPCR